MAEQEQDRSEPATPFKLEEARRKGQVAKSLEVNSFAALSVALLAWLAFGTWAVSQTTALARHTFVQAGRIVFEPGEILAWSVGGARAMLAILLPLMLLMVAIGMLSNLLQTGPVFSAQPMKPDFSRINPAKGFKRLFSMRMVYEAIKSLIKLALFGVIVWWVIRGLLPMLMGLTAIDPVAYPAVLMRRVALLMFFLLLAVFVVAVLDLAYTRWEYGKQMRMSRRELRDEVRRREGDPQVRARRRDSQQALRRKAGALKNVREADVIITNPLHVAVALRYDRATMIAPQVTCKGTGRIARLIRRLAARHRVPVRRSPALARHLYRWVEIDGPVPEACYAEVATLLRSVYARRATQGVQA